MAAYTVIDNDMKLTTKENGSLYNSTDNALQELIEKFPTFLDTDGIRHYAKHYTKKLDLQPIHQRTDCTRTNII